MVAKRADAPMSGEELREFIEGVLAGLSAPATEWNLQWMEEWARSESTLAGFNPYATTMPAPGATIFNHVKVRNFPDAATGIDATVRTLRLSYYVPIVHGLRTQSLADKRGILKSYQTWSGTNAPEAYHIARLIKSGWTPSGSRTLQSEETAVIGAKAAQSADVSRTAKKAVRDTVATTPAVGALVIGAVTATDNWGEIGDQLANGHWATAIGLFVATPVALALWRIVRGMLGQAPAE